MGEDIRWRLDQEPWDEPFERLTAYAQMTVKQLFWRSEISGPVRGNVAIECAMDAIAEVYSGSQDRDRQHQPDPWVALCEVVRSKIRHAVQAVEHKDIRQTDELLEPAYFHPDYMFLQGLYQEIQDAPRLQIVLEAIVDGLDKRAVIARALALSSEEVSTLRRQLGRRLTAYRAKVQLDSVLEGEDWSIVVGLPIQNEAREVLDALLDFVEDPDAATTMPRAEIQAYLEGEGIVVDAHRRELQRRFAAHSLT